MGARESRERARREKLERAYAAAPGRYRLRLLCWAALGQAVLVAGLLGCMATLLAVTWQIARVGRPWEAAIPTIVLLATTAVLVRALAVRFAPPEGYRLDRGDAPALVAEIERVRLAVGARRLDGVFIDAGLNAAAVHVPRAAGLLPGRHYLVLGLPLLELLDREELAAVIAHEFGHFHDGGGHFSPWVYRVRAGWHRVARDLARQRFASQILLALCLRWYLARLDAVSLVVARQQELAADAVAARTAGATATASGLARMHVAGVWMERRFWPDIEDAARTQAYPVAQVHQRLCEGLLAHRALAQPIPAHVLHCPPCDGDTHPPLDRRLAALGTGEGGLTAASTPTAATELLGTAFHERLQVHFSQLWQEGVRQGWRDRHARLQRERQRLDELERLPGRTPGQTFEYARLLEVHCPTVAVDRWYAQVLEALPTHPGAHGWWGIAQLREGRPVEGEAALRRALELDPSGSGALLSALYDLQAERPTDGALWALGEALHARHAAAIPADETTLAPAALDAAQLSALVALLSGEPRIANAWLVRRGCADPLAPAHHLLLVHWKGSLASEAAALPRLAARLPGPGTIALLGTPTDRALARRVRATAGMPFHRRP